MEPRLVMSINEELQSVNDKQIRGKSFSPRTILAGTFILFLGPFLFVMLFPAQLDRVMDKSSYLVFHNVAEFFSIMVSLSVFSVGWFTYDQSKDRHTLFLGVAFLAVGLLDFMHTMSNGAMPAFITPNSTNKSTQFWITARLVDASAFLASAYIYPNSKWPLLSRKTLLGSALIAMALVFAGVVFFPEQLPATAVQGVGLTPLKRCLEFIVILMLAAAALAYWQRMKRTEDRSLVYFPAAFIICIFSEGVFASYKTGFDTYNVLGHIYKVIAFYLIYKGVFIAAVRAPYEKLVNQERIKHLASFPQLNPNPILEISSSGKVTFANPAADALLHNLGIGSSEYSAFFPDDFDVILLELKTRKETTLYREVVIEGRVFSENINLAPQFDTARIYAFDVTERKRAEKALLESETKYRALFENMNNGFALHQIVVDESGKPIDYVFLEVNSAFEMLTGLNGEDVLNKSATQTLPGIEKDPADWIGVYGSVALTGKEHRFEQYSEQLEKWYAVMVYSPMRDHFATLFEDISERKRAEDKLQKAYEELEQRVSERTEELKATVISLNGEIVERERMEARRQEAELALRMETLEKLRAVEALREKEQMLIQQSRMAAMGEMIGNIAHQWRQPLNTLGLEIQQLLLFYDLGEFDREFLNKGVSNSMELIRHMSRTIDDFRNYFMPDKEKAEFNVFEAINKTTSLLEGCFKNTKIGIEIIAEARPLIYGYQNEFAQVILNILVNARDALVEKEIHDPQVTITLGSEHDCAVVTIADNAGGIPGEIMDKIFDPYFTTKGPQHGTGVGLFMSKTIIEKNMGGRLTVRNCADGAEFRIEMTPP